MAGVPTPSNSAIIAFMVIVFSANLVVNYFGTHFEFLRSFFGSKVYEVTKASKNLPISSEPDKTIDITRIVELRRMLLYEQLEELNAVLEEYQNIFQEDLYNEYKVNDAYRAFYITVPS